jgi:hypothetical protein
MALPGFTATESLYTGTRRYVGAPARRYGAGGSKVVPALIRRPPHDDYTTDPVQQACEQKCADSGYPLGMLDAAGACTCWDP